MTQTLSDVFDEVLSHELHCSNCDADLMYLQGLITDFGMSCPECGLILTPENTLVVKVEQADPTAVTATTAMFGDDELLR